LGVADVLRGGYWVGGGGRVEKIGNTKKKKQLKTWEKS